MKTQPESKPSEPVMGLSREFAGADSLHDLSYSLSSEYQ